MNDVAQNMEPGPVRELRPIELQQASGAGVTMQDVMVTSYQTGSHSSGTLIPVKIKHNL